MVRKVILPIVSSDLNAVPRVVPGNGLRIFPWCVAIKARRRFGSNKAA